MPDNSKFTDLCEVTCPGGCDWIAIADTSMCPTTSKKVKLTNLPSGFSTCVVCDTTPQLGGPLQVGNNYIEFCTNETCLPLGTQNTILLSACDLHFNVTACDNFTFKVNNITEYTYSATEADWNGNNLRNVGYLESNACNPAQLGAVRLGQNEGVLWRNAANTADFGIWLNSNNDFNIDRPLDLLGTNALTNAVWVGEGGTEATTGFLRMANASSVAWRNNANTQDLLLTASAGDDLVLDGPNWNALNLNTYPIINVGYLESNAANPAAFGVLRIGDGEQIGWRNSCNTADNFIRFAGQAFNINVDGGTEYAFSATVADFNNNNICNVQQLQTAAANPASVGTIRMGNGEIIGWRNNANTNDLTIFVDGTDTIRHQILGGNQLSISACCINAENNNLIMGTGVIEFQTANTSITETPASTLQIDTPACGIVQIRANNVEEYNFSTSQANFNGNNIRNVGFYETNATNPASAGAVRLDDGESIAWRNACNSLNHEIGFGITTPNALSINMGFCDEYRFNGSEADFFGNNLRNVGYFETNATNPASTGAIRLGNNETVAWRNACNDGNMTMTFASSDIFLFSLGSGNALEIGIGTVQYNFDDTRADFLGNNLINAGYLESNATTPAGAGTIRLGNTESVAWRNFGNTNDILIDVNTADDLSMKFSGTQEFVFDASDADWKGNNLINVGYLESNAASPSTCGAIRLGTGEVIGWRACNGFENAYIGFESSTVNKFTINIGGGDRYNIGADDIDYLGNDARNVGFLESNAANPAGAGTIRLGNNEDIRWRNAGNTADYRLYFNDSDEYVFFSENNDAIVNIRAQHTTPVDGTSVGDLRFMDDNSVNSGTIYGEISVVNEDPTSTQEDAEMFLKAMKGGTLTNYISINEANDNHVRLEGSALVLGNGTDLRWNDSSDIRITGSTTGFVFEVDTNTDTYDFTFNASSEYIMTDTEMNFQGNNLINVGYFESNAGTPASQGAIRLGTSELIAWRSSENDDDISITSNGSEEITFQDSGASWVYNFGENGAKFNGNEILNVSYIDFGAGSADSGTIRLPNASTIEWEASPAGSNGTITYNSLEQMEVGGGASDVLIMTDTTVLKTNSRANFSLEANHTTPANGNEVGNFYFIDDNSVGGRIQYASIEVNIEDPTSTQEDGEMFLKVMEGGTLTDYIVLNDSNGGDITFNKQLNMNNNGLSNVSNVNFDNANTSLQQVGNTLQYDVPTSGDHAFRVNDVNEYVFFPDRLEMNSNNLIDVGYLAFGCGSADAGTIRLPNAATIEFEASPASCNGIITFTSSERFDFSHDLDLSVQCVHNIGQLRFSNTCTPCAGTPTVVFASDAIRINAPACDTINLQINGTAEYTFSSTQIDVNGNNIVEVQQLGSNGGNLPTTGFIVMSASESIRWRNACNSNDNYIDFAGDAFGISFNNTEEYSFTATQLNMNNSDINFCNASDIRWQGDSNKRIHHTCGTGFSFLTTTGSTFNYLINAVTEYQFSATALDMNNNNLIMGTGGSVQFGDADTSIQRGGAAGHIDIDVPCSGDVFIRVNDVDEYQFCAAQIRMNGNNISNTGILYFGCGTDRSIQRSSGLQLDVDTGETLSVRIANTSQYIFGPSDFNLTCNPIVSAGSITFANSSDPATSAAAIWEDSSNDLLLNVSSCNFIGFRVNGTGQLLIDGSVINALSCNKFQEGGTDISPIGRHSQWIGAQDFIIPTSSGVTDISQREAPCNNINYFAANFDTTTEENIQFEWRPEDTWDNGTVTATFYWSNDCGLTTETVTFGIKGVAISNDDPLDSAFGCEVNTTDTWLAQGDMHISPESSAVTIGGSPADADYIVFNVIRKTGVDNLTGDAQLIGVRIFYTTHEAVQP